MKPGDHYYHIRSLFGGEFNLADLQVFVHLPNLNKANTVS